jgi:hypothetical protein
MYATRSRERINPADRRGLICTSGWITRTTEMLRMKCTVRERRRFCFDLACKKTVVEVQKRVESPGVRSRLSRVQDISTMGEEPRRAAVSFSADGPNGSRTSAKRN